MHTLPPKQTDSNLLCWHYPSRALLEYHQQEPHYRPILKCWLTENMFECSTMQDVAPQTAKKTQWWSKEHLPGIWGKDTWPGNSLDLNLNPKTIVEYSEERAEGSMTNDHHESIHSEFEASLGKKVIPWFLITKFRWCQKAWGLYWRWKEATLANNWNHLH